MAKQNSKTDEEETRKMKKGTKNIADILTKDDIDLIDKLDNMYESEISEEIYEKCNEPEFFFKNRRRSLESDERSRRKIS